MFFDFQTQILIIIIADKVWYSNKNATAYFKTNIDRKAYFTYLILKAS